MTIGEIISNINWVDILVLTLLFRIGYVGFHRGLGSELVPLIGAFFTLILALNYYFRVGVFIADHTPLSYEYSYLIIYLLIALISLFIFRVIDALIVGRIVTVHIASIYDKIFGLIAGIFRGILLVSLVLIALELVPNSYIRNSVSKNSLMGTKFLNIGRNVHEKAASFLRMR